MAPEESPVVNFAHPKPACAGELSGLIPAATEKAPTAPGLGPGVLIIPLPAAMAARYAASRPNACEGVIEMKNRFTSSDSSSAFLSMTVYLPRQSRSNKARSIQQRLTGKPEPMRFLRSKLHNA